MANMTFKANLLPSSVNYSLGSSTAIWDAVYAKSLDIGNDTTLHGSTYADDLTAGNLMITGASNFTQIPTAPTAAAGDSS